MLLLLHGAGGSVHSFRHLIPLLAPTHRIVALDLPGQGLTQLGSRNRCGLDPMSADIANLIAQEGWQVAAVIGHSAGGALALRLAQRLPTVRLVIGINPALGHFRGMAGLVFPVMAKVLALTPGVATFFSRSARNPDRIRGLIEGTGSHLTPDGQALYRRLVGDRDHVDATLLMMAQWSLDDLLGDLPNITTDALFLAGDRDEAVAPDVAERAAEMMPNARIHRLPNVGHLAHEETPEVVAAVILAALSKPEEPGSLHV